MTAREYLLQSDAALLAQCEMDTYRASGPGGQKRNKTSSAVRLRHTPTGLIVTAVESRSQHENRERALRRLRQAIALTQRNVVEGGTGLPEFYAEALRRDASLHVSQKHGDYLLILQYIFDVLAQHGVSVADASESLQISTGQLVRFLKDDEKAWQQAAAMRQAAGLPVLR